MSAKSSQEHELIVLQILGSAVAGRDVLIAASSGPTCTDGEAIYLAPTAGARARLHVVTAQAALVAGGSLDLGVMHSLVGTPARAAQRYLALELARSARQLSHLLPMSYEGLLRAHVTSVGRVPVTAEESRDRALSSAPLPSPPAWCGVLKPGIVLRRSGAQEGRPTSSAEAAASAALVDEPSEPAGANQRSRLLEKLSGPFANPIGRALQRIAGAKASGGDGDPGGAASRSERRQGAPGRYATRAGSGPGGESARALRLRGRAYPEWDMVNGAYRSDWCTVIELAPRGQVSTIPAAVLPRSLVRELAAVSQVWLPVGREHCGDDLSLDALVDHAVAVLAGLPDDARVFHGERRRVGDLSVVILVDATGSAAEEVSGRSVFHEQRLLVHQLSAAFETLGIRAATYGFRSHGRHDVRFLRVKSFGDRWGLASQQRLHALQAAGYTRLGAALRHGTHLLEHHGGTPRKLLLVVGDGFPYDDGYEGRSAIEDCRRAVEDAAIAGVAVAGVSTRPPGTEPAWGAPAHLVAADPDVLADQIRRHLTTALTSTGSGARRRR